MIKRVDHPPNPFHSQWEEYLEEPPAVRVQVYEEWAKSILSENDSPDLPFRWSVNPYRGCQHACAYCYARPYHEFLDLGAGSDFDTRIFVKVNAPQLLREALRSPKWAGETVHFSGVTDCYQPLEAVYLLTQKCLEVCLEAGNSAAIVTKSYLVMRDAELLGRMARQVGVSVIFSMGMLDESTAKLIEPHAPIPARRLEAMRRLREAGVPVGVLVAPIIPGLSEQDIPAIIERAVECGADSAAYQMLRLPGSVEAVFMERLYKALPLRAKKIENRIREVRGGPINDARFGHRMRGQGTYWESIQQLFQIACRKQGLADYRSRATMKTVGGSGCSLPLANESANHSTTSAQLDFPFI
ncbi:MAG: hypothetical protein HJJLKODD_01855 [Phycisphaerae bacterium]|nr:hypothetical protein [Phycisphaerae bacterium]